MKAQQIYDDMERAIEQINSLTLSPKFIEVSSKTYLELKKVAIPENSKLLMHPMFGAIFKGIMIMEVEMKHNFKLVF